MQDLKNTWALVTGASSGFGMDFAHLLAQRGANLVLVARRVEPMQKLAHALQSQYPVKVKVIGLDLGLIDAATRLKAELDLAGIRINTLINNAGFGLFGEFVGQALAKTEEMLALNIMALTRLTHVFAQDMREQGGGHIYWYRVSAPTKRHPLMPLTQHRKLTYYYSVKPCI